MTLTDTGPSVALIDGDDKAHTRCMTALPQLSKPLITTWPCFTEAMYLLAAEGGYPAQEELWSYLEDGIVILHFPGVSEHKRMRELMHQYKDTPMDFADASLVTAAEVLGMERIFTVDSDFYVYQRNGNQPFEVIP